MKFFDENYSQEIPARIKCLRKKYNLKQSDLGNAGQVSQVEKEKRQVTASILLYLNTQTDLDYKEIIFRDIAKFVENLFYHCFSSIIFRVLETVDRSEVSIQYESIHKKNADFKRFFFLLISLHCKANHSNDYLFDYIFCEIN